MCTIVQLPVQYRPHPQNPNHDPNGTAADVAKWLHEQAKMLRLIADTADRAAALLLDAGDRPCDTENHDG